MKTLSGCVLVVLAIAGARASAQQQQQPGLAAPSSTSALSGLVIDGVTRQPVQDAIVVLTSAAAIGNSTLRWQQFTDAKGRYVFVNLSSSGQYALTASAISFIEGVYAIDAAGAGETSSPIALAADEWQKDRDIVMWRPSTIAGRVVDESGEGIGSAFVRAFKRTRVGGADIFVAAQLASTDDLGNYRLTGLTPGGYLVQVPSVLGAFVGARSTGQFPWAPPPERDGRPRGYPATFYPGARMIGEATSIVLGRSDTKVGIDITLQPVELFRVSGRLTSPLSRGGLRLVAAGMDALGNGAEAATAEVRADGAFEFMGVPAGDYAIDSTRSVTTLSAAQFNPTIFGGVGMPAPPPSGGSSGFSYPVAAAPQVNWNMTRYGQNDEFTQFVGKQPVSVGRTDVSGLSVLVSGGAAVSGRLQLDADAPSLKPSGQEMSFFLEPLSPASGVPYPITIRNNEFTVPDVRPGRYFLRQRGSTKWVERSVLVSGTEHVTQPFDVTAAPLTIQVTLTNRACAISGTVSQPGAIVVAFLQQPREWIDFGLNPPAFRVVDVATNGSFNIEPLPAGDYFVAAVSATRRGDILDREFLAALAPRATRLSLTWGDRRTVDLAIVSVVR